MNLYRQIRDAAESAARIAHEHSKVGNHDHAGLMSHFAAKLHELAIEAECLSDEAHGDPTRKAKSTA